MPKNRELDGEATDGVVVVKFVLSEIRGNYSQGTFKLSKNIFQFGWITAVPAKIKWILLKIFYALKARYIS
jgi:hypothetical protein